MQFQEKNQLKIVIIKKIQNKKNLIRKLFLFNIDN